MEPMKAAGVRACFDHICGRGARRDGTNHLAGLCACFDHICARGARRWGSFLAGGYFAAASITFVRVGRGCWVPFMGCRAFVPAWRAMGGLENRYTSQPIECVAPEYTSARSAH